jgi:plasmid stability protein
MANRMVRNIDPALTERLRIRAAQHGQSMEAEVRQILRDVLREPVRPPNPNLYGRIRARFAPIGGVDDLEVPPREPAREPPKFD